MTTDTTEKGLETLIMRHMTGEDGLGVEAGVAAEARAPYGGTGYIAGSPKDYDPAQAVDVSQLFSFLQATQPERFNPKGEAGLPAASLAQAQAMARHASPNTTMIYFHNINRVQDAAEKCVNF